MSRIMENLEKYETISCQTCCRCESCQMDDDISCDYCVKITPGGECPCHMIAGNEDECPYYLFYLEEKPWKKN